MANININGISYVGNSISICNGDVVINGKKANIKDKKDISIKIDGDVENFNVDSCNMININGNVKDIETVNGDIKCKDVSGSVKTVNGDVSCDNIAGNVSTVNGDIG